MDPGFVKPFELESNLIQVRYALFGSFRQPVQRGSAACFFSPIELNIEALFGLRFTGKDFPETKTDALTQALTCPAELL